MTKKQIDFCNKCIELNGLVNDSSIFQYFKSHFITLLKLRRGYKKVENISNIGKLKLLIDNGLFKGNMYSFALVKDLYMIKFTVNLFYELLLIYISTKSRILFALLDYFYKSTYDKMKDDYDI